MLNLDKIYTSLKKKKKILITFYQVYVKGCYINLKTDC